MPTMTLDSDRDYLLSVLHANMEHMQRILADQMAIARTFEDSAQPSTVTYWKEVGEAFYRTAANLDRLNQTLA